MNGVEIRVRSNSTQAQRDLANLEKSVKGIETSVNNVTSAFTKLAVGIASAVGGTAAIRSINKATDSLTSMENRLALVVGRGEELASQMDILYKIASKTRTPVDAAAETFNRFGQALKGTGRTVDEINLAIESIGYAGAISGGSVESLRAALFQLGQGLASGTLRGEELNSVLEQAPRIASAIADSLEVPVGSLRKLAEQGELTTQVVFDALISQSAKLKEEFALVEQTSDQALSKLGSTVKRIVGEISKQVGITSGYIKNINALNTLLESNRERIVLSVSSVANSLKDSVAGAYETLKGIGNILIAIGQRAKAALPNITVPMREFSQDLQLGFITAGLYARRFFKNLGLDTDAMIKRFLDIGFAGAFRDLFNASGAKEVGAALYNIGEVLKRYGNRWYDLNNQQEKFIRSTKVFLTETGIYLGIIDQKLVRLRYTSFERFGKAIGVVRDGFKAIIANAKASDIIFRMQLAFVKLYQIAIATGEALNSITGGDLGRGLNFLSNTFKDALDSARAYLKPVVDFVNSALTQIERKFFWVYDQVIGNSWWTDTMTNTYSLAKEWLSKAYNEVNRFVEEVSGLYKWLQMIWTSKLDSETKLELTVETIRFKKEQYLRAGLELAKSVGKSISDQMSNLGDAINEVSPKIAGALALALTAGFTRFLSPSAFAATFGKLGGLFGIALFAGFMNKFSSEILNSNFIQLTARGVGDAVGAAIKAIYDAAPEIGKALVAAASSFGQALKENLKGTLIGLPAQILGALPFGAGGLLTTLFYGGLTAAAFSSSFRGQIKKLILPAIESIGERKGKGLLYNLFVGSNASNLVEGITNQLNTQRGPAIMGMDKRRRKEAEKMLKADAKKIAESTARANLLAGQMAVAKFAGITTLFTVALGDAIGTGNAMILGMGAGFLQQAMFGPGGYKSFTTVMSSAISVLNSVYATIATQLGVAVAYSRTFLGQIFTANVMTATGIRTAWSTAMTGIVSVFGANLGRMVKMAGLFGIITVAFAGLANAGTSASGDIESSGIAMTGIFATLGYVALTNLSAIRKAFGATAIYIATTMPKLLGAFSFLTTALYAPIVAVRALNTALIAGLSTTVAALNSFFVAPLLAMVTRVTAIFAALRNTMYAAIVATSINMRVLGMTLTSGIMAAMAAIPAAIATGLVFIATLGLGYLLYETLFGDTDTWPVRMAKAIKKTLGNWGLISQSARDVKNEVSKLIKLSQVKLEGVNINEGRTLSRDAISANYSGMSNSQLFKLEQLATERNKLAQQANAEDRRYGYISEETRQKIKENTKAIETAIRENGGDAAKTALTDLAKQFNSKGGLFFGSTNIRNALDLNNFKSIVTNFAGDRRKEANRLVSDIENNKFNFESASSRAAFAVRVLEFKDELGLNDSTRTLLEAIVSSNGEVSSEVFNSYNVLQKAIADSPLTKDNLENLSFFAKGTGFQRELQDSGNGPLDRIIRTLEEAGLRANDPRARQAVLGGMNIRGQGQYAPLLEALAAMEDFNDSLRRSNAVSTLEKLSAGFNRVFEGVSKRLGINISGTDRARVDQEERARLEGRLTQVSSLERQLLQYSPEAIDVEKFAEMGAKAQQQAIDKALAGAPPELIKQYEEAIAQLGAEWQKAFRLPVDVIRGSVSEVNKILSEVGGGTMEAGALIGADITSGLQRIQELQNELADTALITNLDERAKAQNDIVRQLQAEKTILEQNVKLANANNIEVTERMGLLQSAVGTFDKFEVDFNKLLRVDPATLEALVQAGNKLEVLNLQIANAVALGQFDLAASLSKNYEEVLKSIASMLSANRSKIEKTATDSRTAFEKLLDRLSGAGFGMEMEQAAALGKKSITSLQSPLKAIEDAQKRINKAGLFDDKVRVKALETIRKAKAAIADILFGGTVDQANVAGQAFGIDNASMLSQDQLTIGMQIYDLQQRLNAASNADLETKKALTAELARQQILLAAVTTGAEESSYAVRDSIKTNLGEFLKGTKSLKDAVLGVLDTITSRIIDTFVNTMVDTLWEGQLKSMFDGIFAGIASAGSSAGKKAGEMIGESMGGGVGGSLATTLLGKDGLITKLFGSIFGEGGFFSSIFSFFSGGTGAAASHAGGIVQNRISGGLINPGIGQAGKDSVPVMLTPGEYVLPSKRTADLFKQQGGNSAQQTVVNLNVTGDISRQTKQEIMRMIPQIASGVNSVNRERTA